ncbi:MAG: 4Fe-4S dicluster domain-containing protein [Phycisphaerales bacterium]
MNAPTEWQTSSDSVSSQGCECIRWLVRTLCLLAAVLALWPILPVATAAALVPALSPFVAVSAILTTWGLPMMVWLGLIVVLVRRRLFCRWVCPVGLCMDGASRLGRRLGRRTGSFPRLGPWIVLFTLGGACLGYPFLLWLDPLARFAGLFDLGSRGPTLGVVFSMVTFLAMLAISFRWPNAWCGCVCPLGAFQDLLSLVFQSLRSLVRRKPAAGLLPRRMLLGAVAGAAFAAVTGPSRRRMSRPLRPPGAVDEPAFVGLCTRCGNCVRACPSGIIERDLGGNGWAGLLTPVLSFHRDYCREDCVRCAQACPSGALKRVPQAKKGAVRLGLPRVDMSLCLLGEDRECSLCRSRCPYDAVRYVFSEADYTLTPQIDPDKCNGCGACEAACPTSPHKAIIVFPA